MGADQSTLQVPTEGFLIEESLEQHAILNQYRVEAPLVPGSGRMMRTFRLRHRSVMEGTAVLKGTWIRHKPDESYVLDMYRKELERIRAVTSDLTHVAPYTAWFLGDPRQVRGSSSSNHVLLRPVYLLRPHFYTTLSDRMASRPWPHLSEKLWITSQILSAVQALHDVGVVHGFITTENIAMTSTGWVILTDLASSYKPILALPDDDPSEYLYYFQPQSTQHPRGVNVNTSTSSTTTTEAGAARHNEKRCYLAPERFYSPRGSASSPSLVVSPTSSDKENRSGSDGAAASATSAGIDVSNTTGQPTNSSSSGGSSSSSSNNIRSSTPPSLTPAMDIFSVGCVLTELFLNGESCLDLGDLMEYRRLAAASSSPTSSSSLSSTWENNNTNNNQFLTATLEQKLNKIESSAIRAACKHMLQIDPSGRWSAKQYTERLESTGQFPSVFSTVLTPLVERVTIALPTDARIALAATAYNEVLWETVGIRDWEGQACLERLLGPTVVGTTQQGPQAQNKTTRPSITTPALTQDDIFAQTEALLRDLDALSIDDNGSSAARDEKKSEEKDVAAPSNPPALVVPAADVTSDRSPICKGSLVIYLGMIHATVRSVQRPSSKLVGLQLMQRLAKHSSDEARLQRIVPVAVSMLHDQDSLVRASAVRVLTYSLSIIDSFPPSDSKVFPQYIFKRVGHLISDPSLVVRLAFARCIAVLAESAHRFLDISHAVRLYEAVGSGRGENVRDEQTLPTVDATKDSGAIFGDDVTRLLDAGSRTPSRLSLAEHTEGSTDSGKSDNNNNMNAVISGRVLISSTYDAELASLHETVSRWVVTIMTDQSEYASAAKRALLLDVGRLCNFLGLDGSVTFVLPQILAFLNERRDWELRAALFEHLPSVCHIIGRAATEKFVLPCLEIGLVDNEEQVISRSLGCLCRLFELGLVSRASSLGFASPMATNTHPSLLQKYGVLMLHPSDDVRSESIRAFAAMFQTLGQPDVEVNMIPLLAPLCRFQVSSLNVLTTAGLKRYLRNPWTREQLVTEMGRLIESSKGMSSTSGTWTSIGLAMSDNDNADDLSNAVGNFQVDRSEAQSDDPLQAKFRDYLVMLLRHTVHSSSQDRTAFDSLAPGSTSGIEGSVKLSQSILFPRQNGHGQTGLIPEWYASLQSEVEAKKLVISAASAIRSVSSIGHVYGLSILGPGGGVVESIVGAADDSQQGNGSTAETGRPSSDSESIEAAFVGEWGSEALLEPDIVDTCLLVTKLKAMGVPPLPPLLGEPALPKRQPVNDIPLSSVWKPKISALMASSSPISGHTAPVVRLAVSGDHSFFVSGSHDGTCRIWDLPQVEDSVGFLDCTAMYTGHCDLKPARVVDIAMLEGSHSVVSGASDGSVHVWRVDLVPSAGTVAVPTKESPSVKPERSRAVGTTSIRRVDSGEGEILALSSFATYSASIITFATQKGAVHSWDMRCAREPFKLSQGPSLGYMTSMAIGPDRHWLVTGTSRGFLALWDIRFQSAAKVWRHSRGAPINRIALSFVPPPQMWGSVLSSASARPFVFVASGSNECAMFDALTGSCSQCFRTMEGDSREINAYIDEPPSLVDVDIVCKHQSISLKNREPVSSQSYLQPVASVNCMVGSIGAGDSSYLITGGGDCKIRFWDFAFPSRCFVVSGQSRVQPRPSYERIDFEGRRLMVCRQSIPLNFRGVPMSAFSGGKKPDLFHSDSIQDLKIVDHSALSALISCSRDCTVKVWR